MKIIFTDQALISINSSFDFYMHKGVPAEKINILFEKIFDRIDGLAQTPFLGQKEFLIIDPKQEYRRIIESHFKIVLH